MAKFSVYDNSSDKNISTPYLVDVQTDLSNRAENLAVQGEDE
jgi:hypothetical protein